MTTQPDLFWPSADNENLQCFADQPAWPQVLEIIKQIVRPGEKLIEVYDPESSIFSRKSHLQADILADLLTEYGTHQPPIWQHNDDDYMVCSYDAEKGWIGIGIGCPAQSAYLVVYASSPIDYQC